MARQSRGYENPVRFYVEKIAEGVATIAAAFWPKKVIVRMSDFKSNEYRNLVGGTRYEPTEENPMLGFRGASRYIAQSFRECFRLECEAMRKVRDTMGLTNVELMIPFVRTIKEGEQVLAIMKDYGLERGKNGLRIVMMCEIPSNAILADDFLKHFDGFSIGSNDMTQMTLALDRDSGLVMDAFDERDPAVKRMLHLAIQACRKASKYVGICGQGPSDYPDLAEWLMHEGIESMSLNPDTVVETWLHLAKVASPKAGGYRPGGSNLAQPARRGEVHDVFQARSQVFGGAGVRVPGPRRRRSPVLAPARTSKADGWSRIAGWCLPRKVAEPSIGRRDHHRGSAPHGSRQGACARRSRARPGGARRPHRAQAHLLGLTRGRSGFVTASEPYLNRTWHSRIPDGAQPAEAARRGAHAQ